jgi:hypothetical protein
MSGLVINSPSGQYTALAKKFFDIDGGRACLISDVAIKPICDADGDCAGYAHPYGTPCLYSKPFANHTIDNYFSTRWCGCAATVATTFLEGSCGHESETKYMACQDFTFEIQLLGTYQLPPPAVCASSCNPKQSSVHSFCIYKGWAELHAPRMAKCAWLCQSLENHSGAVAVGVPRNDNQPTGLDRISTTQAGGSGPGLLRRYDDRESHSSSGTRGPPKPRNADFPREMRVGD